MFGEEIWNAMTEIADILKRKNIPQFKCNAEENRVAFCTKQHNSSKEPRLKNSAIHIPKLPSIELFIKQLNKNTKNEQLNQIFDKDKKSSIDKKSTALLNFSWQQP